MLLEGVKCVWLINARCRKRAMHQSPKSPVADSETPTQGWKPLGAPGEHEWRSLSVLRGPGPKAPWGASVRPREPWLALRTWDA